jgi:hypothetical protein
MTLFLTRHSPFKSALIFGKRKGYYVDKSKAI